MLVMAYSLVEWILGRQDRVEVVEPAALRQYIIGRLQAAALRYGPQTDCASQQIETDENIKAEDKDPADQPKTTVENAISNNATAEDEHYLEQSRYTAVDDTNEVIEWLAVRLLHAKRVDADDLEYYLISNLEPLLSERFASCLRDCAADDFHEQAKLFLNEEPILRFDEDDPFTKNTTDLADRLSLGNLELTILRISVMLKQHPHLNDVADFSLRNVSENQVLRTLATITGKSLGQVQYFLQDERPLRKSGLITERRLRGGKGCPYR